jgi:hypothetical protein
MLVSLDLLAPRNGTEEGPRVNHRMKLARVVEGIEATMKEDRS